MGSTCKVCGRPSGDGEHFLNEMHCNDERGEVCRLHAALSSIRSIARRMTEERDEAITALKNVTHSVG